jgi:hypothetical protein
MLATLTMADVEGKGFGGRRGEGYGAAMARDIHLDGCLCFADLEKIVELQRQGNERIFQLDIYISRISIS